MSLRADKEDAYPITCDGCGREIPLGEVYLGGIGSCCGGCYRSLCRTCVQEALRLLEKEDGK